MRKIEREENRIRRGKRLIGRPRDQITITLSIKFVSKKKKRIESFGYHNIICMLFVLLVLKRDLVQKIM